MKTFTSDEVSRHSGDDSLWVTRDDRVYDVTDFAGRHPGGRAALLQGGGGEVTSLMRTGHQHSDAAYQILDKYQIGWLSDEPNGNVSVRQRKRENGKKDDNKLKGWREDELIDWSKPLYWQVGHLGDNYMEWVHSPVDRQIKLFRSEFAEFFSTAPWWVVPIVWLPVMCMYITLSFLNYSNGAGEVWMPNFYGGLWTCTYHMPFLFGFGAVMWSLFEYVVHRWLFHMRPPSWSPFLTTLHFVLHGQHHKAPMDRQRLVFPPLPASVFGVTISLLYLSVFPVAMAQILLAGTAFGYVIYDLIHYYLHHGSPSLRYFQDLKNYHVRHHFVNQQKGFGISHKFWDYTFGTVIPMKS
ncbi:hypothetical protein CAPTEDRAFT_171473 [Capitella teleta]|uniref:Fatty acid 2-hydroxylase n=1 Tax=Capitella teleta TaxID=283909 RepID=R7UXW0_CAPTE|nr:hypothetical protein CAPTEDRAFT_171473 [Capitella teleta]|eukprot:ELU11413.1 hypothetical protein CAPTEDRAFT_171473 [Capitella teleta]